MTIQKIRMRVGIAALCLTPMSAMAAHGFGSVYEAKLHALNNSGVSGTATLAFRGGDTLTVVLNGQRLTADASHIQHIHGLADATVDAVCPNIGADTGGDNLLSLAEAGAVYGPPILSLDPAPTAAADGSVNYAATITLGAAGVPSLDDLGNPVNRVVVLHGMTINGAYDATIPVACGEINRVLLQEPPVTPTPVPTPVPTAAPTATPAPTMAPRSGNGGSGSLGGLLLLLMGLGAWSRRR